MFQTLEGTHREGDRERINIGEVFYFSLLQPSPVLCKHTRLRMLSVDVRRNFRSTGTGLTDVYSSRPQTRHTGASPQRGPNGRLLGLGNR